MCGGVVFVVLLAKDADACVMMLPASLMVLSLCVFENGTVEY